PQPFQQKRVYCFFQKGTAFYLEYNLSLCLVLLLTRLDLIGAIDLDTILPCYWISRLKNIPRTYDAHELFCEMKEVVTRPAIHRVWKWIERYTVPRFTVGYTVSEPIAEEFKKLYNVNYPVIRNLPFPDPELPIDFHLKKERYLIYSGAVNEGRCFETLIPAMKQVSLPLMICGEGNFLRQAKELVKLHGLQQQIKFMGKVPPEQLRPLIRNAWAGITLFEATGKSNYFSLANRFFDYLQAGIPQLCVDFPAYRALNNSYRVAVLVTTIEPEQLARELNRLNTDSELYEQLTQQCLVARKELHWDREKSKLLELYHPLFQ
ncbi:MAG: glycosyltransferase, partial [Chitinophagaceae bacterium]